MGLENHYLSAIVIIGLGKKHKWMLKERGENLRSNRILQNILVRCILITK